MCKKISTDDFEYLYFGLMIFEPILRMSFFPLSLYKIYQIFFIFKIIIDIYKKKSKFNIINVASISGLFLLISGICYQTMLLYLSLAVNLIIICYIMCKKGKEEGYYTKLLYVLGMSIVFSTIYGIFRGATLDYGSFIRRCTTFDDPNYSACFIDIGLFCILGNKAFSKREKIVFIPVLFIYLLLTVSLSGILICITMFIIYSLFKNGKKTFIYLSVFAVLIAIFLLMPFNKSTALYGIQHRIISLKDMTLDDMSSGRVELIKKYSKLFSELPSLDKLFGGNNVTAGPYKDYCISKFNLCSHNSYIDMLFMVGYFFTIIINILFIYNIFKHIKIYKEGCKISLNIVMLKIILLLFASTLTMFPSKYFWIIYLLTILDIDFKNNKPKILLGINNHHKMKITFYSNFMNHHQLPLSLEMIKQGIDYTFVATEPIPQERLDMGYDDMNKKYDFILTTYDSEENKEKAMKLCLDSDLVILGSAPEIYIKERMKLNKITFRYSERIFRKGRWRIINPRTIRYLICNHLKYRNKKLYMLCASAYTAGDFAMIGAYKNKCFKWGYFPEIKEHNIDELIENKNKNKKIKILWCARLLKLKHPESMITLAKKLIADKYDFEINMLGNGELFESFKNQIKIEKLELYINLIGAVNNNEVSKYMEQANIFAFTSDFNEGWGAVLNESMNSGCAVVASSAIGSVPFLIKNNVNGLVYNNGDNNDLYEKVRYLIDNTNIRNEIAKNAYITMRDEWNAENAVKKLLELYNDIKFQKINVNNNGVCSISNNFIYNNKKG
ncbi:MAG: glycosyltransferase family 4 protein [Bacilli bacterium]